MAKGVIYIQVSSEHAGYVRIGYDADERRVLRRGGVYATYRVAGALNDKSLRTLLARVNPRLRPVKKVGLEPWGDGLYEATAEEVYQTLEAMALITGTEADLHRVLPPHERRRPARREPFRFSMVGLKPGDVITHRNQYQFATMVDDSHVEWHGRTWTLSALTKYVTIGRTIRPTQAFTYDGETLQDRRERMEAYL